MKIACVGDNCIDFYDETGMACPGGNPVDVTLILKEGAAVWGVARVRVKER